MMTFEERMHRLAHDPIDRKYRIPYKRSDPNAISDLVLPQIWPQPRESDFLIFGGVADLSDWNKKKRYSEGRFVNRKGESLTPDDWQPHISQSLFSGPNSVPSDCCWGVPWGKAPRPERMPVVGEGANRWFMDDTCAAIWREYCGEHVRIFKLPLLLRGGVDSGLCVNVAYVVAAQNFIDFENSAFELMLLQNKDLGLSKWVWRGPGPITLRTDIDPSMHLAWHWAGETSLDGSINSLSGPLFISRTLANVMREHGYVATPQDRYRGFLLTEPSIENVVWRYDRWLELQAQEA